MAEPPTTTTTPPPVTIPDFVLAKIQIVGAAIADTQAKDAASSAADADAASAAARQTAARADALSAHQATTAATADLISTIEQWTGTSVQPAGGTFAQMAQGGPGRGLPKVPPWLLSILINLLQGAQAAGPAKPPA